jgi:hypothetical protein
MVAGAGLLHIAGACAKLEAAQYQRLATPESPKCTGFGRRAQVASDPGVLLATIRSELANLPGEHAVVMVGSPMHCES